VGDHVPAGSGRPLTADVWRRPWPGAQGLSWPTPRSTSDEDVHDAVTKRGTLYPKVNTRLVQRDDIAASIRQATTESGGCLLGHAAQRRARAQ